MTLSFRRGTYADHYTDILQWVAAYNKEHVGKMATIHLNDATYRRLEIAGQLFGWFAFENDRPVGVVSYTLTTSRHYPPDIKIALHDFFYVQPQWRAGIVPLQLYRAAEEGLRAMNIKKIFMVDHIRFQSRDTAFRSLGYAPVEVVYEKEFSQDEAQSHHHPSPLAAL